MFRSLGKSALCGTSVHADRAAGGDRHHRHPHRPAAAGGAEGARGGRRAAVPEQPQADRPGATQLRQHERLLPECRVGDGSPLSGGPWPNAGEGTNWSVYILPYMEQDNIFKRLTFTGDSGWTNDDTQKDSSAVNNVNIAAGADPPDVPLPVRPATEPDPQRLERPRDSSGNETSWSTATATWRLPGR